MAFASDRDLVALEPNLFRDVGWVGQRLSRGVGDIAGTMLTLTSQDVDLAAAGVGTGHVALVGGTSYEVVERLSGSTLRLSRVRDDAAGAVLPPSPGTGLSVEVRTFGPQLAIVHDQVLRMAGIDPDDAWAASQGRLTEGAVTNGAALARVEALGALHLIYAAASAPGTGLDGWADASWSRAMMHRERFAAERQRVAALLDLDGDGQPDAIRRLNVLQFVRE